MRRVLIAVGTPMRRDDGVGPAVAEAVRDRLPAGVRVVTLDGEPTRIVETWAGADLAVVVDAVRTGAPPGTLHRWDGASLGALAPPTHPGSSHGLGLREALALGRALDRLPDRLVVLAVEGADFGPGDRPSGAVVAAIPAAAAAVAAEFADAPS